MYGRAVRRALTESKVELSEHIVVPFVSLQTTRSLTDEAIFGYLKRIKERGRSK